MTRETLLTLCFLALGSAALATEGWTPPPPITTQSDRGSDSDHQPHKRQAWTGTCKRLPSGALERHTAFGHTPEAATADCIAWLTERAKKGKGGTK